MMVTEKGLAVLECKHPVGVLDEYCDTGAGESCEIADLVAEVRRLRAAIREIGDRAHSSSAGGVVMDWEHYEWLVKNLDH
jgi:hypothetical protein